MLKTDIIIIGQSTLQSGGRRPGSDNVSTTDKNSKSLIYQLFQAHPTSVGESYFEHMAFALRVALTLFTAGFAALIHALIPRFCQTTASSIIKKLARLVQPRQ